MQNKTKQQTRQEKRLQAGISQAKKNKAELNAMPAKGKAQSAKSKGAAKKGGFFDGILKKIFGTKTAPQTAQQSIPYREMYKDGLCRVNDRLYTKTIVFQDINYQLAQNEDKTQIFESYCDFLNYFDSSITLQLSFINQYGNIEDFKRSIDIPDREDEYNSIRHEYSGMLKNQLAKGNNGLVKTKYVTFGIEADRLKEAKMRIERIEADILANFKVLGVKAQSLNGKERLEILHSQLHPGGVASKDPTHEKLCFNWDDITKTGLSTKDFIAPTSFDFRDGKTFRMGTTVGAVSFVQILAPELTDRMLADFLDLDTAVTVNIHIQSIDQSEAIKSVKRKLSDLDKMKIEEQKKAVRSGYDMDSATRSHITVIPQGFTTVGV